MDLFITHCVYLSTEERKALKSRAVETAGVSFATTAAKQPLSLTPPFCRYTVVRADRDGVELAAGGYTVSVNTDKWNPVVWRLEDEVNSFILRAESPVTAGGKTYACHHQVVFKELGSAEKAAVCSGLAEALRPAPRTSGSATPPTGTPGTGRAGTSPAAAR